MLQLLHTLLLFLSISPPTTSIPLHPTYTVTHPTNTTTVIKCYIPPANASHANATWYTRPHHHHDRYHNLTIEERHLGDYDEVPLASHENVTALADYDSITIDKRGLGGELLPVLVGAPFQVIPWILNGELRAAMQRHRCRKEVRKVFRQRKEEAERKWLEEEREREKEDERRLHG